MKIISILYLLIIYLSPARENIKIHQWRGENREGIYQESDLLKVWPAEGPKEICTIDNIGNGFVSPVFAEDQFFITGETDSKVILYCFNLKGEKQWQTTLGNEWIKSYPGSRTAPTIVDGLIYVGSGLGNLYCVRRDNGKLEMLGKGRDAKWQRIKGK